MITIYGMKASGNCYKLQLLLSQLGRPYQWKEVDILNGGTRTPEFLARNPNGKVPVLELDDGRTLAESNAILCFLAAGSRLMPEATWSRAKLLEWLFFEQYSHEPYIAVARFINKFLPADHPRRVELPRLHERGNQALKVMDQHLARQDFFLPDGYGAVDIALFAYTHSAADGGFSLKEFPAVSAWVERVSNEPRHVPMLA